MTLPIRLRMIAELIPPGASVLDVGCGDGTLLAHLRDEKGVDGRGVELDASNVAAAVARGLSVVQADADRDLAGFPGASVDYAVLSDSLQAMHRPRDVLRELLRIGQRAVVSFPNFGHWRVRWQMLARGRMPVTRGLPVSWHETANIHLCTIADFRDLADGEGLVVDRQSFLAGSEPVSASQANWRADWGLFVLRRRQ